MPPAARALLLGRRHLRDERGPTGGRGRLGRPVDEIRLVSLAQIDCHRRCLRSAGFLHEMRMFPVIERRIKSQKAAFVKAWQDIFILF